MEDQYQVDADFYVQVFANQFASKYHQNPKAVYKQLVRIINRDDEPLVLKRSRDVETGVFLKMNKCDPNIINQIIEVNCLLATDSIDAEICGSLTSDLIAKLFNTNARNVKSWSIANSGYDRFSIIPTEAKYICIQKDGDWITKYHSLIKLHQDVLSELVKSSCNNIYNMIPKEGKSAFKTHFVQNLPSDVFVCFYPARCNGSAPAHKDNTIYGATVTCLTLNSQPGLFYVPLRARGAALKKNIYPISIEQGKTCCIFKGIEHQVIWDDQQEIRMTVVCRF